MNPYTEPETESEKARDRPTAGEAGEDSSQSAASLEDRALIGESRARYSTSPAARRRFKPHHRLLAALVLAAAGYFAGGVEASLAGVLIGLLIREALFVIFLAAVAAVIYWAYLQIQ